MGTEAQDSLHQSLVIVTKYMMRSNCREEGLVRGHSPIEGKAWRQTAPFVKGGCKYRNFTSWQKCASQKVVCNILETNKRQVLSKLQKKKNQAASLSALLL